ncbi:MAG TPA: metal-sensitive transcriptional regulator [Actinomycetota bacterium]|nr:metal-sensitive transcriptional regulator [Actinomycetota bacterium]
MAGYAMGRDDLLARLRRVEGQVRGLQRMVEEERYCIDVLTQVNSAVAALRAVGMGLLDDHVRHCVRDSIRADGGDEKVEELVNAVARFAN